MDWFTKSVWHLFCLSALKLAQGLCQMPQPTLGTFMLVGEPDYVFPSAPCRSYLPGIVSWSARSRFGRRGLKGSWHDAALGEISHPDKITDGFMIVAEGPPLLFANAHHANAGHGAIPRQMVLNYM